MPPYSVYRMYACKFLCAQYVYTARYRYGTQGGGRTGSYTEFNAALEEAIRLRAGDAEAERARESHREGERGTPPGVNASWVKPQPPERPSAKQQQQQQQHRQLKPAVR